MSIKNLIVYSLKEAIRIIKVDEYILWQPSKGDSKTPLGPWYAFNKVTGEFNFNTAPNKYSPIIDTDVIRNDDAHYWGFFGFTSVLSDVISQVEAAFSKEAL